MVLKFIQSKAEVKQNDGREIIEKSGILQKTRKER